MFRAAPIHTCPTWVAATASLPTFDRNSIPNIYFPFCSSLISDGFDCANGLMTWHHRVWRTDMPRKELMVGSAQTASFY
jgi:hypothetical protein